MMLTFYDKNIYINFPPNNDFLENPAQKILIDQKLYIPEKHYLDYSILYFRKKKKSHTTNNDIIWKTR